MDADNTLAGEDTQPGASPEPLGRGATLGRYVILGELGAGGMGVVYAAYDPELDRKVAVKVLHPGTGSQGSAGAARLVREAQALAKLSHPNVVAIHDVGTHGGDVWIAMEFVAGRTLGAWLSQQPRSWREVLAVVHPVALGLQAAHEAGVVHRDVKPDNIMLGDDGRARVMDFGLARGRGSEAVETVSDDELSAAGTASRLALSEVLTRAGATPGTPAYMSPEQFAGAEVDGRSDQFSLCVVLWQALYGERPFAGDGFMEIASNVLGGQLRAAPRDAAVPRWLRRVLLRGLATRADDRFASLAALLEALRRGRTRALAGRVLAGVGVVALGASAVVATRWLDETQRIAACGAQGAEIELVWNEPRREALRAGLLATGVGNAATTADKVMPWLDDQAGAWNRARTDACLDATVHHTWDAEQLDRAQCCLDDRRLELDALVGELADAKVDTIARAVQAAASLRSIAPCRDVQHLSRLPALPTEEKEELLAIRAELARARALEGTGAYEDGLRVAELALARAEAIDWPPLSSAARLHVSSLLDKTGAYKAAEALQERAFFEAANAGATEEALTGAQALIYTVGYRLGRPVEGERWSRFAELMRGALHDPAGLREATSLSNLAAVRQAAGAYDEAATLHERALAIRESALGPDHPDVAQSLNNLANARYELGEHDEAARLHERSLQIREKALGPDHPDVATSLSNLANVRHAKREFDQAAALLVRATEIREHALGPDHPVVAMSLNNLANVRYESGAFDEATALLRRALAIREKALGPEHAEVAQTLNNLGRVRSGAGDREEAAALYERALAIWEKALGPDHPDLATNLNNLAAMRFGAGKYDEAAAMYVRALGIWEKALGPDHVVVSYALAGLARVALEQRRPNDAVPLAERAIAIREAKQAAATDVAEAKFLLARALAADGATRARAVALAEQARDAYRDGGDAHEDTRDEVDAWLREHGGGR